jgi:hypothetical protein
LQQVLFYLFRIHVNITGNNKENVRNTFCLFFTKAYGLLRSNYFPHCRVDMDCSIPFYRDSSRLSWTSYLKKKEKRIYLPESANSQSFATYSPFTLTYFFPHLLDKLLVPAVQKVLSSLHSQFHIPRLSSSSV